MNTIGIDTRVVSLTPPLLLEIFTLTPCLFSLFRSLWQMELPLETDNATTVCLCSALDFSRIQHPYHAPAACRSYWCAGVGMYMRVCVRACACVRVFSYEFSSFHILQVQMGCELPGHFLSTCLHTNTYIYVHTCKHTYKETNKLTYLLTYFHLVVGDVDFHIEVEDFLFGLCNMTQELVGTMPCSLSYEYLISTCIPFCL